MFFIERLFGIACYLLALLFVFWVIYYRRLRLKDALFLYAAALTLFAYFYEPYETADLYRIRNIIQILAQHDFRNFAELYLPGNSTPAAYILFWAVGKIGNVNLLPAAVALITYAITFYILYRSHEIYQPGNRCTAVILLFVMGTGNYLMVISNIRTMLAIALLCFCFFRESVLKRFRIWHIALYLFAALLHNFVLILIALRCLAFVLSSALKLKWKLLIFAGLLLVGAFALLRYEWLFASVVEKALSYITGDSYSYVWEYVIGFLALFLEIAALRMYKKSGDTLLKEQYTYLLLCTVVALVLTAEFSIFHRTVTYVAPIIAIPLLSAGFASAPVPAKTNRLTGVLLLSVLMLFVACARGSLSALKFFVL